MNPTQTITRSQLREKLGALKGATFVTISALTDARARKTGNPYEIVQKLTKINGVVGADYESSVNRQLDREGKDQLTFTAKPRKWGKRISSGLVVGNDGVTFYMPIQPRNSSKPVYFATISGMRKQVSKDKIQQFLPEVKHAENQGTEKEIVYRDVGLESITAITMGGESFRVRD